MIEFNADGSIKLPQHMINKQNDESARMNSQHCIKIVREVVSTYSPKKCVLELTLSKPISDSSFVSNLYKYFAENAQTPTSIRKIDDKTFEVEIGSDFRRCSDCSSFISRIREHLSGNIIDVKGNCTYKTISEQNWCDEDYFD